MKAKNIYFASRLASLALFVCAIVGLSSCSKDDDEPSVDDVLSEETTPVTFRVDAYTAPIFFDYTEGWRYIGSDTVKNTSSKTSVTTLNLHQGKHNIVAAKDIYSPSPYWTESINSLGLHFNPERKTFYLVSAKTTFLDNQGKDAVYNVTSNDAYYWHRQLEVSPYLLPEQQPEYQPVTARLFIIQTDQQQASDIVKMGDDLRIDIPNVPVVEETSITGNDYKLRQEPHNLYGYIKTSSGTYIHGSNGPYYTLCPRDGLQVGQLVMQVNITKQGGYKQQHSVALPKFTLRRGYVTILRGPFLTGSDADWSVEMLSYDDYPYTDYYYENQW